MAKSILGISAYYHDSAAALIRDGEIIAAAQEERFTRIKHDHRFPKNAIGYCLSAIGSKAEGVNASADDIDFIAFYDKPFLKFERILESYLFYVPKGYLSFIKAMPLWLKKKLWIKVLIQDALPGFQGEILFPEHHQSHAASAFFPSPFNEAAIITTDGVGEWSTTSLAFAQDNEINILKEIHFPHSLGLLYSAFTYYTGFKVNSGEYKIMGLAPYGKPKYVQTILENLIDIKEDGSFRLNMDYFNYTAGLTMTSRKFNRLFGGPARKTESELRQKDMDLARSIQEVIEMVMLRMARHAQKISGSSNLCLAGGVALNCVANGKILRENIFDRIWIQPAAGDAGGAVGAALAVWHQYLGRRKEEGRERREERGGWRVEGGAEKMKDERLRIKESRYQDKKPGPWDFQKGSYLGPEYAAGEIKSFLDENKIIYKELGIGDSKLTQQNNSQFSAPNVEKVSSTAEDDLFNTVAKLLSEENIIGWFQGRMEFGPRALGARSIIGDARSETMQKKMNLKIKYRESFRPFAPAVLAEDVSDYFEIDRDSPYMLLTANVRKEKRKERREEEEKLWGIEMLNLVRSEIPAVTHVDYSARVQTVHNETNPYFWQLLSAFKSLTGCPLLVNTSFNVRGEPMVCTPEDAYRCFMRTEMDYLVLGNFLLAKKDQPASDKYDNWQERFELD